MSVQKGREAYTRRNERGRPTVAQLAASKAYDELAKRWPTGRGALKSMSARGDRNARAALAALGETAPEPET